MDRNFKGIWIPKEIWLSEDLTTLEKILLVEIDSLEDEEKGCFASNKYFADFFKLTNGRISQIINNLNKKKYISIDYQYKGKEIEKRILRINRPPYPEVFNKLNRYLENDDRGVKFSKEGYLENAKDNNIYINNIIDNKKKIIIKEKFETFWKAYPKKLNRAKALTWFEKHLPDDETFNTIMIKLEMFKNTDQWQKDNGQYIPYATTWLNQKRWEDEIESEQEDLNYYHEEGCVQFGRRRC